jgi:two-component system chemotaxis response regulator CheY
MLSKKLRSFSMAKTFLVVDDSAAIRQLVLFTLKEAGFNVLVAANGTDAVAKLVASKIDMVITDINMPDMDGIELIRKVRCMPDYKFTPILILTTEAQEEKKKEGRRAGASGWIMKPFSSEQLLDVVKRFVKAESGDRNNQR